MSTSIANLNSIQPYHGPGNNPNHLYSPNSFILFTHSSKASLLSSNSNLSSRTCNVTASVSLSETTQKTAMYVDENAKICKFCEMGHLRKSMELLTRSQKSKLDLNTYCSVLQLCAEVKSLEDGKRVHSIATSNGMKIEGALGAKLVFMYVNCGDLIEGRRIFDKILNV